MGCTGGDDRTRLRGGWTGARLRAAGGWWVLGLQAQLGGEQLKLLLEDRRRNLRLDRDLATLVALGHARRTDSGYASA